MKDRIIIATIVVALAALVAVGVLGSEDSSDSETKNIEANLAGYYWASEDKIPYAGFSEGCLYFDGTEDDGKAAMIEYMYSKDSGSFVDNPVSGTEYYVFHKYEQWNSDVPSYYGNDLSLYSYNEDKRIYLSAGTHDIKISSSSGDVHLCSELEYNCDGYIQVTSYYETTVTLAIGGYYYVMCNPYSTSNFSGAKVTLNVTNCSDDTAQTKSGVSGTAELTSDNIWVTKEVKGEGDTEYELQAVFFVKDSVEEKEFYNEYVSKNKYYSGWPTSGTYLESGKTYVKYRLYSGIYIDPWSDYNVCNDNVYKMYTEYGNELKIVAEFDDSKYSVYLAIDERAYSLENLVEYTYKPVKTSYAYLYLVSKTTDDCMGGTIGLDVSGAADNDDNAVVPAVICLVLFALTIAIVVISMQKPKWSLGKTE